MPQNPVVDIGRLTTMGETSGRRLTLSLLPGPGHSLGNQAQEDPATDVWIKSGCEFRSS